MRLFSFITLSLFLACSSPKSEKDSAYSKQIDSLQVRDLYDSARWYLYTWNCDALYKPKEDSLVSKPLSEIDLKLNHLVVRHDTLILLFDFVDKGKVILAGMTRDNRQFVSGVGFNIGNRKKIFMVDSNVYFSHKDDPESRYVNPLQPDVVGFIKRNSKRLNPWFRGEAERRAVI